MKNLKTVLIKKSPYKEKQVVFDFDNMSDYTLLGTSKRKLREPVVKGLVKHFKAGGNTEAPLIVIVNGKIKTILDGMHRKTGMERAIIDRRNQGIDLKIEQVVWEYPAKIFNSPSERGKLFKAWNKGTPQNSDDFISMFSSVIPIYNLMTVVQKGVTPFCPPVEVSIYPDSGKLHFRKWLGAFDAAKKSSAGGNSLTNEDFVLALQKMDINDYDKFREMVDDIQTNLPSIFERGYRYQTTTAIAAIVYLYYRLVSVGLMTSKVFWTQYHKYAAPSIDYEDDCAMTGGAATKKAQWRLHNLLRKGIPANKQFAIMTELKPTVKKP